MRILLDTHALIWWLEGNERLSIAARREIVRDDAEVLISAVSAYEVTQKVLFGKLPSAVDLAADFAGTIAHHGFQELPITVDHAALAGLLAIPHRDPFDRLLIAQSQLENMPLVSNERRFDDWGVRRLW